MLPQEKVSHSANDKVNKLRTPQPFASETDHVALSAMAFPVRPK